MFDELRRAWRQAVANFHHEMSDGDDPVAGAAHARALRREIATARGVLAQLDAEIGKTSRAGRDERTAEADCRRREQLAKDVGDAETVRLAIEFAVRHAERAGVLERKVEVLTAERALLAADLDRMEELAPAAAAGAASLAAEENEQSDRDDDEFRRLRTEQRERIANERLEELKRRVR